MPSKSLFSSSRPDSIDPLGIDDSHTPSPWGSESWMVADLISIKEPLLKEAARLKGHLPPSLPNQEKAPLAPQDSLTHSHQSTQESYWPSALLYLGVSALALVGAAAYVYAPHMAQATSAPLLDAPTFSSLDSVGSLIAKIPAFGWATLSGTALLATYAAKLLKREFFPSSQLVAEQIEALCLALDQKKSSVEALQSPPLHSDEPQSVVGQIIFSSQGLSRPTRKLIDRLLLARQHNAKSAPLSAPSSDSLSPNSADAPSPRPKGP